MIRIKARLVFIVYAVYLLFSSLDLAQFQNPVVMMTKDEIFCKQSSTQLLLKTRANIFR